MSQIECGTSILRMGRAQVSQIECGASILRMGRGDSVQKWSFCSVMVAYGGLKDAIQTVIDLTSPIGPNHSWLSPSSSREIGDNITILTNDITKLINQLQPQV